MTSLSKILAGRTSGVFSLDGDASASTGGTGDDSPLVVRIDAPTGKQALLEALSARLSFPPYFGFNWDALYDCLTDLPLARGPGLLLEITGLQEFARAHPEDLRQAIETFADAARYWASRHERFVVVLGGLGRLGARLPKLEP
jgi:RNAse (barnase) inhibitor barstar